MEVKSNIIKSSVVCLMVVCLLTGFACTSENKAKEETMSSSTTTVPSDEQLLDMGIQKLDQWTGYWKSKGASFNNMKFDQEYVYERLEWPGENILTKENPLKSYQLPHPAAEGVVDIYGYKMVFDEDQEVNFNPDSEVVYYRADGMRERLMFIGPSGVFEDAVWITEDHLLVTGHIQKENGFVPVVWLINPEEHKYAVYEAPFSTQDYTPESFLKVKLAGLNFSS